MKNIKIIITVLAVALFAVSCETYDDYEAERTTVVGFTSPVGGPNAVVPAGGTLEKQINVFASDLSSSERTFNVVVNSELSEVNSENFSFGSVVIPANERAAVFTVTFTDVSLSPDLQPLRLEIDSSNPESFISGNSVTIQVRKN